MWTLPPWVSLSSWIASPIVAVVSMILCWRVRSQLRGQKGSGWLWSTLGFLLSFLLVTLILSALLTVVINRLAPEAFTSLDTQISRFVDSIPNASRDALSAILILGATVASAAIVSLEIVLSQAKGVYNRNRAKQRIVVGNLVVTVGIASLTLLAGLMTSISRSWPKSWQTLFGTVAILGAIALSILLFVIVLDLIAISRRSDVRGFQEYLEDSHL